MFTDYLEATGQLLHACRIYHYGNQMMIRPCCVDSCVSRGLEAKRHSITPHNACYLAFVAEWNSLTNAEMKWVKAELARNGITEICGYLI